MGGAGSVIVDTLTVVAQGPRSGGNTDRGGGYATTLQGQENEMRDSVARSKAHERRQAEETQRAAAARPAVTIVAQQQAPVASAANLRGSASQFSQIRDLETARFRAEQACWDSQRPESAASGVERSEVLQIGVVVLDAARHEAEQPRSSDANPSFVQESIEQARLLLDIALSFVPGVGLSLDIISLSTRHNPVTGLPVGDTEAGLLLAGILVPGALQGAALGVKRSLVILDHAILGASVGAKKAESLVPIARKADTFITHLASGTDDIASFKPEATLRLAQATHHVGSTVRDSAKTLRSSQGVAIVSRELFDSDFLLRGTHRNAGLVPLDIADKLEGQAFSKFDQFRKAFWMTVSESKYAHQLGPLSLRDMKLGLAPAAQSSQHFGGRVVYELHHIAPISRGGNVYDLSNIMVTSPRFHSEVLDRSYHYSK